MPRFAYTALDARGSEQSGSLDAANPAQASARLRSQGLFPTELTLQGTAKRRVRADQSKTFAAPWRISFGSGISRAELAVFTRQLATLLRAGMPLVRGLEVLARQERNPATRVVIQKLAERLRAGGTLSAAMAENPRIFDRLYVNMVRAGEAGGALEPVLERLARFAEKSLRLRGKIRAAMIYPAVVLAVATGVLAGLVVFVVPRFQQIFADLLKGAPLPPLTQAVLAFSDWVRGHWGLALAVTVLPWVATSLARRTPPGRQLADAALLRAPLFGGMVVKAVVARLARTLGTLLASGVPILPALLITRETCGNARIAAALDEVHDRVKAGESVARPLEATGVIPPLVTSLIDVGEQTGQLPGMLGRIADIYEEEVDNAAAGLGSALEPLLILFLAVVVGVVVIALFLPIVRIVQLLT